LRLSRIALAALATITLTAAKNPADPSATAPKLTEAEATRIAMAPLVHWDMENAKVIDTVYAPDAIGFDASTAPLVANSAAFVAINQDFMAMNFDKVTVPIHKVQVLSEDIFIFTSDTELASTTGPGQPTRYRCTDVFKRQAAGEFLVVNEHCSFSPK
jgi:ketosteroid isomerase-like protein